MFHDLISLTIVTAVCLPGRQLVRAARGSVGCRRTERRKANLVCAAATVAGNIIPAAAAPALEKAPQIKVFTRAKSTSSLLGLGSISTEVPALATTTTTPTPTRRLTIGSRLPNNSLSSGASVPTNCRPRRSIGRRVNGVNGRRANAITGHRWIFMARTFSCRSLGRYNIDNGESNWPAGEL